MKSILNRVVDLVRVLRVLLVQQLQEMYRTAADPGLRAAAEWLPMTAAVDLMRPLALGRWPADGVRDIVLLSTWGGACYYIALGLTRRRMLK